MGLIVDWRLDNPGAVGIRLADRLGLPRPDSDADEVVYLLSGGRLRLMRAGRGRQRAQGEPAGSPPTGPLQVSRGATGDARDGVGLAGVGWATVELGRASREVASALGVDVAAFTPAADDGWLGARAAVAAVDGSAIVLLEPSTEGRIAAALARHGEGPAVIWLDSPRLDAGATRPGPLGPAELVHGPRPWGPFLLRLVGTRTAGTIRA